MQVGAALAVLLTPKAEGRGMPLSLQAAKCRLLHTEAGAGAVGLLALSRQLQGQGAQGVMLHLRTLNPYVASAIQASLCQPNSHSITNAPSQQA